MKIRVHHLYLFFHSIGSPTGVHPKVEEKMFHWSLMLQSLLKYLKVKVCLLNRLNEFIFTQLTPKIIKFPNLDKKTCRVAK